MDTIHIKKLEVFARHGVLPEENILGQKFLISASLYCDTAKAGRTDSLKDSVNYAKVAALLVSSATEQVFKLIERLAWHLAKSVLIAFPAVRGIDLEIEKPWAPVMLPLQTVSVKISRQWNRAYLSIGSNLGDRESHLREAIRLLKEDEEIRIAAQSSFLETKPVGYTEQGDFLNGALAIDTLYSPQELLKRLNSIEDTLGRERKIHWGPRTIDLDIIFYNNEVIQEEGLIIPHREMARRMFVLKPLEEIAPHALHPLLHRTVSELAEALSGQEASCK